MAAEIGALRVRLGMNAGEFHRGTKEVEGAMDRLAKRARTMATAVGGAFAVSGLARGILASVRAYGESEAAIAAVEAVVKSTGGTAGRTTTKLVEMAKELKALTGIDDEKILMDVTKNLLTFTNIVGPVFDEAQIAVLNLSTALKQDLQSSAIQLGKALNDPVDGLTALRRVGIQFTESQKDQIKTLMQTGDVLGAQRIILKELTTEFGGQAVAIANTVQGKLNRAFVELGDAMESIGKKLAPIIMPIIEGVTSLARAFETLPEGFQRAVIVAGTVGTALAALAAVVGLVGAVFGTAAVPIIAVVAAISLVAGAIAGVLPSLSELAGQAEYAFSSMSAAADTYIASGVVPILSWLADTMKHVLDPLGAAGPEAMDVLRATIVNGMPPAAAAASLAGQQIGAAMSAGIKQGLAGGGEGAPALSTEDAIKQLQARALAEIAAQNQIAAAKKAHSETEAEFNKLVTEGIALAKQNETPRETELRQLAALDAAYKKNKISAEALGRAQIAVAATAINAYASLASQVGNSLTQLFNKSKGVAIASALINTFEAVTKAMAAYPPPYSFIAAGAALAAGLAQVQNIRKTNKDGGGGAGGGGGGGESAAPAMTQAPQTLMVEGIKGDQLFSGDTVKALAEKLLQYQRDGGRVVLA
jgi:hypothetical protein